MRTLLYRILNAMLNFIGAKYRSDLYRKLHNSHVKEEMTKLRRKYSIHESFEFNGQSISFYGDGQIVCGPGSYIGNHSTIQADSQCAVHIGKGCHISHNVRIYTTTNVADQPFNQTVKASLRGDVIIEDYVWIGANVFIGPNVKIGLNSVIGANSVVTKNIPSNTIWAGAPARMIKEKTIKL